MIDFRILAEHPEINCVEVRLLLAGVPESAFAVQQDAEGNVLRGRADRNILLPDVRPEGEDFRQFVLRHAPTEAEMIASMEGDAGS